MAARPSFLSRSRFSHLLIGLAAVVASGCAAFRSSQRIDVEPFAENTVGMIGEVQRATKPVVWVYLKKYETLPSIVTARHSAIPARTLMRGIALYSTQLVSIYDSDMPMKEKCEQLANYLDSAVRERIENNPSAQLFITPQALDSAVARVRHSTEFLAALGGAQSVVSAALAYGNSLYDSVDVEIDTAASDIDSRIEREFGPLKEQLEALTDLEFKQTHGYSLIGQYRYGNDAALDSLRAADPQCAESLPAGKRPSAAALDAVEKRILAQLETTTQLRSRVDQSLDTYRAEEQELDQLRIQAREGARLGRITLLMWARSHRNLAAGVKVPAAINIMGMMQMAAGKAAGVVVP